MRVPYDTWIAADVDFRSDDSAKSESKNVYDEYDDELLNNN